jgi:hypothetical protein
VERYSNRFILPVAELGDPADDLAVATVLMMVGGKLVLLKPRKVPRFDVWILLSC